jgi:hypothetical protein
MSAPRSTPVNRNELRERPRLTHGGNEKGGSEEPDGRVGIYET